ncbi:hypothetical protein ACF0H5_002349 [Mactra antiquata]
MNQRLHNTDLFGAHHNDVRLMLTTINALKIMTGLQKARNDSYEHGINSLREVEFKSLCDLTEE